ncbi:DDB1- and CUL4-associated factor 4 [Hyperolius riggenbachi]|uniref:DDB1- and CUL4-associated factor 4 n=1 Tax=Hyperolius riggenbachi TaxID=752182 RepID=UPI0035A2F650
MDPNRENNHKRWRRNSWRHYNRRYESGESEMSEADSASSSSSSASQSSSAPELPGFYYDPEKNRYFRLLPGHNNCNPLTRESILQKQLEQKRLQLLEEDQKSKNATRPVGNATLLVWKRELGLMPFETYCRRVHELKANCMQRKKVQVVDPHPFTLRSKKYNFILPDSACQRLLAVHEVESGFSKYGFLNLNGLWKDAPTVQHVVDWDYTDLQVNDACWATLNEPDSHILISLFFRQGTKNCINLVRANRSPDDFDGDPMVWYNINISHVWCCSWCNNPRLQRTFSAGLSNQVLVISAATDSRRTFKTNSDVLAQQFALEKVLLFNGCRSGEVFSIDLRVPSSSPSHWKKETSFNQSSAITCLRLLQDENYLMVSDMSGEIKLWDLRMVKCVQQYEGHKNSYAHLPLHVKEEEGLLLAVGQDCCTRIWSLADAKLLRTIPSPHPASNNSIPSVVFSSQLGGPKQMRPGLLMAVKKDLYYFTYNSNTM